jgi:hypothetical protein
MRFVSANEGVSVRNNIGLIYVCGWYGVSTYAIGISIFSINSSIFIISRTVEMVIE